MGSWGPAIFSDDLATDLRREYQTLLAAGLPDAKAEDLIFAYYHDILHEDSDDAVAFWLALALSQWKCGRLSDLVKQEALRLIDSGKAVTHWHPAFKERKLAKRKAVLENLKSTLLSPMPPVKKIPKPHVLHCPWKTGSLLAYRIVSSKAKIGEHPCFGRYALLRVVHIHRHPVSSILSDSLYSEMMYVGAYGWIGDQIPDPKIVDQLQYIPLDEGLELPSSVYSAIASSALPERVKSDLEAYRERKEHYYMALNLSSTEAKKGPITCIGYDAEFETHVPEVFQNIGGFTITGCHSFDIILAMRLKRFL